MVFRSYTGLVYAEAAESVTLANSLQVDETILQFRTTTSKPTTFLNRIFRMVPDLKPCGVGTCVPHLSSPS